MVPLPLTVIRAVAPWPVVEVPIPTNCALYTSPAVPEPYPAPPESIPTLTTLLNPCSRVVVIVWAVPECETISVIPIPISPSIIYLLSVSFVKLFWVLSTTTSPIVPGTANDFVSFGSESGVSLLVWG